MMGFAQVLRGVMLYVMVKGAITLGFGILTGTAVVVFLNSAIDHVRSAYNNLPADMLQLLAVAGVPEALGILCGALLAAAGLQFVKRFTFIG